MMNYLLFKLRFDTAVHFGASDSALSLYSSEDHFLADTLFAALCNTAQSLYGNHGADLLCAQAKAGELLLSDSMPWQEDTFFLPKPIITGESTEDVPSKVRKDMKKLKWIPIDMYDEFWGALDTGKVFDTDKSAYKMGHIGETTKVGKPGSEDGSPYQVGLYYFSRQPQSGLYFIAACNSTEQEEMLTKLVEVLGMSGIGGKTSSGYGRFTLETFINEPFDAQTEWLYSALSRNDAKHNVLISASLPREDEMERAVEDASYLLVRRGGFARPDADSAAARKKQTQYFMSAGSVFERRYEGALYEVGRAESHAVYRYGRPMFLGVGL